MTDAHLSAGYRLPGSEPGLASAGSSRPLQGASPPLREPLQEPRWPGILAATRGQRREAQRRPRRGDSSAQRRRRGRRDAVHASVDMRQPDSARASGRVMVPSWPPSSASKRPETCPVACPSCPTSAACHVRAPLSASRPAASSQQPAACPGRALGRHRHRALQPHHGPLRSHARLRVSPLAPTGYGQPRRARTLALPLVARRRQLPFSPPAATNLAAGSYHSRRAGAAAVWLTGPLARARRLAH